MNIHSLQLPIAFIPVTQSRDWLKERAFYWARSLSLSVSGWLMRGDHYHKVRHHMVITLMMFSQGDQQIQWSERRTTKMFPLFTSQVDKRPSKGERRGSFIFRRDIYQRWVTFTRLWFKVPNLFLYVQYDRENQYLSGRHNFMSWPRRHNRKLAIRLV